MNEKLKNLEIKIAQNRGYTTELKEDYKRNSKINDAIAIKQLKLETILQEFFNKIKEIITYEEGGTKIAFKKIKRNKLLERLLKKLDSPKTEYECISCGRPMKKGELCPICRPDETEKKGFQCDNKCAEYDLEEYTCQHNPLGCTRYEKLDSGGEKIDYLKNTEKPNPKPLVYANEKKGDFNSKPTEQICKGCEEHDICVYEFKDITDYCPNRLDVPYPGKDSKLPELKLKIKKIGKNSILPQMQKPKDAGYDAYISGFKNINNEGELFDWNEDEAYLRSLAKGVCRLGFATEIPEGYYAQIVPRSGLALRKGLTILNSPATIDSGYRGEWLAIVINLSDKEIKLKVGDRVCQIIFRKCINIEFEEVIELSESERSLNGLGSTGVNKSELKDLDDKKDWKKEYEELENAMAFKYELPESFKIKDNLDDLDDLDGEKESVECHSEIIGVDNSMDNSKPSELKLKTEKKECKKKVYCHQCNDFIRKTYCKKGYNCYEHAKTLKALHIKHKDLGSEKGLPKHENGLNHMHGINSETSVPDSKLPIPKVSKTEKKKNLDETKLTERFMIHITHCPQCEFRIEVECHESEKSCLKCGNPKLLKLVDYEKWIKLIKERYSGDEKTTLEELNKFADEQIDLQESHYFHKPKETKPKKDFTIEYQPKTDNYGESCNIEFNDGRKYPIGDDVYRAMKYHINKELINEILEEIDKPRKNNISLKKDD